MSAPKHTPGPLRLKRAKNLSGDFAIADSEGHILAECYAAIRAHNERATEEAEANARLYVAAPELLEALRLLVDRDTATVGSELRLNFEAHGNALAALMGARAAIAKATGSAP